MRHIYLKITIAMMAITFALPSCNQAKNTDSQETTSTNDIALIQEPENSMSTDLDFLKELNEKYPYEVKLFDNAAFIQRLQKLIGDSRCNFLTETWAVETPIEVSDNTFVAFGCQAHNCDATNFILVVDFSKDVMYAGIREEGEVETYSEDGSNSQKVNEWANEN